MDRIVEHLTDPFDWVAFLPNRVRADFVDEFLTTARACASIGHFERLMIAPNAWKATAEACATPHLTATGDDLDYLDDTEIVGDGPPWPTLKPADRMLFRYRFKVC